MSLKFGTAVGFQPQAMTQFKFDSKAQRKVREGDTIGVVLENSAASHGMTYMLMFRMLVKLH